MADFPWREITDMFITIDLVPNIQSNRGYRSIWKWMVFYKMRQLL